MLSPNVKIMLIDEVTLFRQGIKQIIESKGKYKIIAEAKDGQEGINKTLVNNPDIIIMDINIPLINGLEILKSINDLGLSSKVIILTFDKRKEYIISAIKYGAKAYLFKDCEATILFKAIEEVLAGRNYMDKLVAQKLNKENTNNNLNNRFKKTGLELLNKREYEILIKISEGLDNKTIGKHLYISEKTVKNNITQILKKLQVKNRVQAALFVYNNIK